jgi:RNA polymerase sigma factor (sigma-70 family)
VSSSPASPGDAPPYPEKCAPFRTREPLSEEQRKLATQFLPLAQTLANRYRFMGFNERDDLESAAYMALVEAAQTFDPARKVNFATYARHRIRGALRDYHTQTKSASWRGDRAERPVFKSLGKGAEQHGQVLCIQPDQPVGAMIESIDAVEDWLSRLPLIHSVACRYIYIYGKTQDEAAALLGCSKSFVSRMHRDAISWLIQDYQAASAGQKGEPS